MVHASAFHLTTTEVALGVPVGVIIAAVVALIGQANVTRKQLEAQATSTKATLESQERINDSTLKTQREVALAGFRMQRQLASDDRLWNARRKIYVRLLAIARKVTRETSLYVGNNVPQAGVFAELLQPLVDMEDEVVAHASPKVMGAANLLNVNLQAAVSGIYGLWSNQHKAEPEIGDFLASLTDLYESNKEWVDDTLSALGKLAADVTALVRVELNDLPGARDTRPLI